ncbi:MAG: aminoacyl-histidine dipeptidase [Flavobacteriaceae bacterium]|nr:aminoacyl-histidine dipeptidase [Flavobacteriaceae bacterium]MDG1063607.1 aminoacyl-histidine dipeptidase [Flavobacteriaceae bacterium]
MNHKINEIEPQEVWRCFSALNAVPRASKKEEKVIDFMVQFAKELDLSVAVDAVGNVLVKKPATLGMENKKTVVMQAHLDMVHQKNNDTEFDFDKQGIDMYVDGDWVRARGTTLGADNGLGVAAIMAVLASKDIVHPALEALFTIDEETGMTGAMGLQGGWLQGQILLNLDTEEDDEIGVGCAGGVDVTAFGQFDDEPNHLNGGFEISVTGLQGGHSGMEIHKGLGNANKLMNRILWALDEQVVLSKLHGGSLRNAIPRESVAIIAVAQEQRDQVQKVFDQVRSSILEEYKHLEPELSLTLDPCAAPARVMSQADQKIFLSAVQGTFNGVYRMSPAIEGLVETSNNVAKVTLDQGQIQIDCLTRSSVDSSKEDLTNSLSAVFGLAGYQVRYAGTYPGWAPNMDSPILKVMEGLYCDIFGQQPNVAACHAGLECGILGQNYPDLDMISFGPTIKGAHSPDERASISSTQKFWRFLKAVLAEIPQA